MKKQLLFALTLLVGQICFAGQSKTKTCDNNVSQVFKNVFIELPGFREIKSCITPRGQITEQYTRPNASVSSISATITTTFKANTAGRNCIFAIQPSHLCATPVKSSSSSVINT